MRLDGHRQQTRNHDGTSRCAFHGHAKGRGHGATQQGLSGPLGAALALPGSGGGPSRPRPLGAATCPARPKLTMRGATPQARRDPGGGGWRPELPDPGRPHPYANLTFPVSQHHKPKDGISTRKYLLEAFSLS